MELYLRLDLCRLNVEYVQRARRRGFEFVEDAMDADLDAIKKVDIRTQTVHADFLHDAEGDIARRDYVGIVSSRWTAKDGKTTLGMSNGDILTIIR